MLSYKNTSQFIYDYKNHLKNKGITSAHVARKIGISPQQLQNIYKKSELTVSDLQNLCSAIDLSCNIDIK